jgi:hypothetical protein
MTPVLLEARSKLQACGLRAITSLLFLACWVCAVAPSSAAAEVPPAELLKQVDAAKAQALGSRDAVAKVREDVDKLVSKRTALEAAIKEAQKAFDLHWRAATKAVPALKGSAPATAPAAANKKRTKPPPVASYVSGKLEYAAAATAGRTVLEKRAEIVKFWEELQRQTASSAEAAAKAKSADKDAQTAAKALAAAAAKAKRAAPKDPESPAAKTALELAAQAEQAKAAALEAHTAEAAAAAGATKIRTLSGLASAAALAAKKAAADRADTALRTKLSSGKATSMNIDNTLATWSPKIKDCDLRKVDWKNMTYPWVPYGTASKPLKLTNGAYVCDEPKQSDCPGKPPVIKEPLYGDLSGDGSPAAVVEVFIGKGDAPLYDVLVFGKDSDCRLYLVGELPSQTNTGTLAGNAYAADLPYAKKGEKPGTATGVEHQEWRIVKGALKRVVDVKK